MGLEKAKYIAAVCLYGTIGLLLHYIALPSEVVVLCRGVFGTATILLVLAVRRQRFHRDAIRKNLPVLLLSGAFLGANWVFLFAAYRATTVAVASLCNSMARIPVQSVAILGYLEPVVSVLTSALILREPLSPAGILGAVLILGAALCSELKPRAKRKS